MPGSRGTARNSKKKPLPDLTEEDLYPESVKDITEQKVESLELKAVSYLERELAILTSTPGNFAEVARILKILKDHKGGKGAPAQSKAPDSIRAWSLDGS